MMLAHNTFPSRNHQPHPYYHGQQALNTQQQQQFQQLQQGSFAAGANATAFSTTLENIPAAAAAIAATQRYRTTPATLAQIQSTDRANSNGQGLNSTSDLMTSDPWTLHGQQTPRHTQRFGHHRDSSLSSVGSNTPASPYNASTTNPQIAVTDSTGDGLHDMTGAGDSNYTYAMAKPMAMADNFYTSALGSFIGHGGVNGHNAMTDMSMTDGLPALTGAQQQRHGGLAPTSDLSAPGSSTRSRPVSVASSVGGDSPATPSFTEHDDEHRRVKNGEEPASPTPFLFDPDPDYVDDCSHFVFDDTAFATGANMPKLDRTMTDIYNDELYNPNFTITSASPPPQTHIALSPTNELFAQRLQAANSQRLSAAQSPVSSEPRDRSPFRQGSPYASAINEFPKAGTNQARLESAQQLRERRKAEQDAKQLQRQLARNSHQQQQQRGTPATISPKDAVLEFNEVEGDSNFPLFPPQEPNTYGLGENNSNGNMNRAASQQSTSSFQPMSATSLQSAFNFSMPTNVQIPQQYPFVSRQQSQQQQQQQTPTTSTFSRMSSAEASNTDVSCSDGPVQRPERTAADSGTYTCTYHGCTLRFETPALLQKHKREGHRQANALNHLRSPASSVGLSATSVPNSQAGPHRCDRINPSTGKPCNTVFSRPYDLTRHEDTIHNARKQKVRCDLCTEEKTFSRADALTRHYRVCHPDVEFPGKHRRRGAIGV
ncbi:hypothetical protein F5Y19DRAFT_310801 [Xylariaceae sp. FL1651]|nr:hypothetical protein F5Y19DRAFT_310801 [Xylariaceae sp. FL1651]